MPRVKQGRAMRLDDLKHAQRERILHLDRCITWRGGANRSDLVARFGISQAQAALDFRAYLALSPTPPAYDRAARSYRAVPAHRPLLSCTPEEVFAILDCDGAARLALPDRRPDPRILARLWQAIREARGLRIAHASMTSGNAGAQWIDPARFLTDGEAVYLRAWSHRHGAWRLYQPSRFDPDAAMETRPRGPLPPDPDWDRVAVITLRPLSGLSAEQAAAVRREYRFTGATLTVETRAVLEFFFDRRWGIGLPGARLERVRTEWRPAGPGS